MVPLTIYRELKTVGDNKLLGINMPISGSKRVAASQYEAKRRRRRRASQGHCDVTHHRVVCSCTASSQSHLISLQTDKDGLFSSFPLKKAALFSLLFDSVVFNTEQPQKKTFVLR